MTEQAATPTKSEQPKVTLKLGQIAPLLTVMSEWWGIKGLPVPFQRKVLRTMRALEKERESFTEIHKRLVDQYAEKDKKGEPIVNKEGRYDFKGENEKLFESDWKTLIEGEMQIPSLPAEEVFDLAEPLGLNLAMLAVLYDEEGTNSLLL